MDVIKSGERLNEKSSSPEDIDSLISELRMHEVKVPESWENRSRQLCQCKDALVCKHTLKCLSWDRLWL